jgi:probable DNA metabolism protein
MTILIFDDSLEGLLTLIFEVYDRKLSIVKVVSQRHYQPGLLEQSLEIISDETKANRVWKGLEKKIGKSGLKRFYTVFLSEQQAMYQQLVDYARHIIDNLPGVEKNFGHPAVMAITNMERSVSRERHRMKAFIRFKETTDGIFYAPVEPDFNVLPLIADFFKNRYADQYWIIYDVKRNYGLYYDLNTVTHVVLQEEPDLKATSLDILHNKEHLYQVLWNDYFKSTNIPARKNMKLHIRHVPKRYWKYLTEKMRSGFISLMDVVGKL